MAESKQKYAVYGYDKDNDTEVFLAGHPDYGSAMDDAKLMWRPLARDGHIRNLDGRMAQGTGEPFDWLVVRGPDGDAIVSLYDS